MKEYEYGNAKNFSIPELKDIIVIHRERIEAVSDNLELLLIEMEELEQELKDCGE